ncbi:MAG: histidine ammonia-lyase [Rhodoferax sp.]|nr:histidine ammonia-lyase [Rhodoferax sp.]
MANFNYGEDQLTAGLALRIASGELSGRITPSAAGRIEKCRSRVDEIVADHQNVYGINTGFGPLCTTIISEKDTKTLQYNILKSHSVGVGEPISPEIAKLMMILKVHALSMGYSGIAMGTLERIIWHIENDIIPVVPAQGSVGASGDLAPLAHLCLPLLGEGELLLDGVRMPALTALQQTGLTPLQLSAKEGLALINGTQVSTALALHALFTTEQVFQAAVISGALTLDAARGSDGPFDARIHAVRGQPGQIDCAAAYRALTAGSEIRRSHLEGDDRVQDPYCLRCQPQVMGACLDQMRYAAQVLLREANAVPDSPLVFADSGVLLSGGNFHAEPVALAADALAVAIAEVGAITERRIAMLVDTVVSRLPPFLTPEPGLNSGFMIVHVTAAALASENKSLAHPASVDSLPTSANQEDHVSMATFAARRLQPMLDNTAHIVAIELLAAAQGIEFLRPLRSSEPLEAVQERVRSVSAAMMQDRSLAADMQALQSLVKTGEIASAMKVRLPELAALDLV